MSFLNGLHNQVDIIPLIENTSNRVVKDQMKNDPVAAIQNVPCRVVKEEYALFLPDTELKKGWLIKEQNTHRKFEIGKVTSHYSRKTLHHYRCELRRAPERQV